MSQVEAQILTQLKDTQVLQSSVSRNDFKMLKMEMDNKLRDVETSLWSSLKDDTNARL